MINKRDFFILLSAGLTFIALTALLFGWYQVRFWRDVLAIVMILGLVSFLLLVRVYYYPGKKIKLGFPYLWALISSFIAAYVMIRRVYYLRYEDCLFFVLVILFQTILIVMTFMKFE